MISSLEHYSYCPRQCGLIVLDRAFDENLHTMRGHRIHERVHEIDSRVDAGIQVETALPLWSFRLGLVGKADVVEFYEQIPFPIEYKYGKRRKTHHDNVQICAQALCLEEMCSVTILEGAVFHYSSRRLRQVQFTDELRETTIETISAVRELQLSDTLPAPTFDGRCVECSMQEVCMPDLVRLRQFRFNPFRPYPYSEESP